jgi:hypothetical protein
MSEGTADRDPLLHGRVALRIGDGGYVAILACGEGRILAVEPLWESTTRAAARRNGDRPGSHLTRRQRCNRAPAAVAPGRRLRGSVQNACVQGNESDVAAFVAGGASEWDSQRSPSTSAEPAASQPNHTRTFHGMSPLNLQPRM